MTTTLKSIQQTIQENLLLLKDLLKHQNVRFSYIFRSNCVKKRLFWDVLTIDDDIFDKYNNIQLLEWNLSINVKSDFYAACNVYSNAKDGRFKIGDHVRISKYNNIFVEGYAPNLSEEIFMIC